MQIHADAIRTLAEMRLVPSRFPLVKDVILLTLWRTRYVDAVLIHHHNLIHLRLGTHLAISTSSPDLTG